MEGERPRGREATSRAGRSRGRRTSSSPSSLYPNNDGRSRSRSRSMSMSMRSRSRSRSVDRRIRSSNISCLSPNNNGSSSSVDATIRMSNPNSPVSSNNESSMMSSATSIPSTLVDDLIREPRQTVREERRGIVANGGMEEHADIPAQPADRAAVQRLPRIIISEEHIRNDNNPTCSICREQFRLGEEARVMPCGHMHHQACIFTWLETNRSCPLCRFNMPGSE